MCIIFWVIITTTTLLFGLYSKDFFENLLVEAHGMLFDLLVISWFLFWLTKKGDKNRLIQDYLNQIEDLKDWSGEEANYRIVGNIKRLRELNYHGSINLTFAKLDGANFECIDLSGIDFTGASLSGARLVQANLSNAKLICCNLSKSVTARAKFENSNFQGACIKDAKLTYEQLLSSKNLYLVKDIDKETREKIHQNKPSLLMPLKES